jgi:hypothetical protein
MARRPSRREGLLLAGLGVALALWLWRSWGTETPAVVEAAAKRADAKKEFVLGTAPKVHMELLDRTVVKYDQAGRDLFKYSVRPPSWKQVKEMRAAAAAAAKAQREAEERARIAALERAKEEEARQAYLREHPVPPPPPQPPAITFKFLGFVGPPNGRIAAFEENEATFVAKTGEIVKTQFRVDEIKYESVIISYVNPTFKGQVRELPLMRGK